MSVLDIIFRRIQSEQVESRFQLEPFVDTAIDGNPSSSKPHIVVIGGGMVAAHFLKSLMAMGGGDHFSVSLFAEEPQLPYDRVHLTDSIKDRAPEDLTLQDEAWYAANNITVYRDELVTGLQPDRRLLITQKGHTLNYDYAVIATGSYPFVPPIPGLKGDGVFVYRTIQDVQKIKVYADQDVRRVAVLGGGLLGLEAAQAMVQLGLEVHVIEVAHHLMPQQLEPGAGDCLLSHVEAQGVKVHLDHRAVAVNHHGGTLEVLFDKRENALLNVDMIVVSTGIRARSELAQSAGLSLAPNRGILVDDTLTTSDPRIFAIGECVSHRGTIYGLVQPGYQMAETLAQNLCGQSTRFEKGNVSTRLKMLGVEVATIGDYAQPDRALEYRERDSFRKLVIRHRRIIGAVGVGPWPELMQIQSLIDQGSVVPERDLKHFLAEGTLSRESTPQTIQQWPDSTLVCNCMRVTKGQLCAAMADGAQTPDALSQCTSAGTLCGSCKPLLAELCGAQTDAADLAAQDSSRSPWLLFTSLLAALVGIGVVVLPGAEFATSVDALWHRIDVLWRDGWLKQFTGYTLLGLCVFAMVLSLRKRLSRFSWGNYGTWRYAHTALGVSALVMLVAHTGMRLGHNFNAYLMTCFLGLSVLGGFAGMAAALEKNPDSKWARRSRQFRPVLTWLHILVLWPLPALLAVHIWMVYHY